ncbi:pPIWI_RE module domain-containing protein [Streptomyces sp. NPDC001812]|uniref:pPIWI_RE module domain-containing protein n=1 Tax=Streptomyces sp. NPDC001812 TaxID=3364611 RepID=UPI0036AF75E5
MYKKIRRSAYHLAEDSAPWVEDFRALPFPEQWHPGLLELHHHGRDEEKRHRTLPTRRLDGVLQTLAPDVIVRPRPRTPVEPGPHTTGDFWMYVPASVPDPLPGSSTGQLLDAWLRTLGPKGAAQGPGFRSLLLARSVDLKQNLPAWQPVTGVELLNTPTTRGGTAAPEPRQFQLATDALARRVLTLDAFPFDGGELRFRALPRGPRDQGAELMSQPLCRSVKRKEWWFSVVLNISLHTTPFDPRPRLHLHWGVRRWATHPRAATKRLNLPYREATTVYLRPTIPWLPGAPATERYALARLRRDRAADTFAWAENDAAGILRGLSLAGNFPDPEQLLSEPASWIGEGTGVRAAVVHSTRMGQHEVGPGLMPNQRAQLTEWVEAALPEELVRVPDLVRGRGKGIGAPENRRPKPRGEEAKKAELLREAQARRIALATQCRIAEADAGPGQDGPPVLEARLLWQSPEVRKEAVSQFTAALGLDGDGGIAEARLTDREFDEAAPGAPVVLEWRTSELTFRLRCLPLADGLGDRLVPEPAVKGRGAAITAAVTTRRRTLQTWLRADGADPSRPSLALVEIAHRSTFRPASTDPKFAIRLGCADAGLLTQFLVTPSTDRQVANAGSLGHRAHSAWLDGLRQLGVRVLPRHTLGDDLPDQLQYAALWMVKRRKDGPTRLPKHLPVAVLVTPLPEEQGLAAVRGWDDGAGEWVPYPRFLLGLVKQAEIDPEAFAEPEAPTDGHSEGARPGTPRVTGKQWRTNLAEQRKETAGFLQRVLHSLRGQPTALITHAQNSRLHWPWLQDGQTERDLLRAGHAPAGRLDDELRLVRVRGRGGRETAQWWGLAEPGKAHGQPAGFWAPTPPERGGRTSPADRVFYSTTERPGTHSISPKLDRLAVRVNAAGNLTSQVGTGAWNPTLVEIAVLGCHANDDRTDAVPGKPDDAEALALAMHQLRQAPDYAAALSLPLPLHLAGLAQAYVLPMLAEGDGSLDQETAGSTTEQSPGDPDLADAAGLATEPEVDDDDGAEPGSAS